MRPVLRALARQFDPLSDAALLERYARDRDPAAFEVLVWRHGAMVLGVCRRHLRDAHAAEDALQATFLILARKAAGVHGDTLPGWLHRVARRVAVRAAAKARRRRETPLAADPAAKPLPDRELAGVLDAEIDRLPDRLRQVVVLCYLDGVTTADAAARLGVPRGTVLSRLAAARAKLAGRLTRRGVTTPAVGLTTALTADAAGACVRLAEPGDAGAGAATVLANEVLAMSGRKTILAVAAGLVLAGGAGTGVGVLNAQQGEQPGGKQPVKPEAAKVAAYDGRADEAARQRAAQIERLVAAQDRVEKLMHGIRGVAEQLRQSQLDDLDPAALRAALLRLDEQILKLRYPTDSTAETNPLARRRGVRAKSDFDNLNEAEANSLIDALPEVRPAVEAVRQARERQEQQNVFGATGTKGADQVKHRLEEATARLNELRAANREKAIQVARQDWEQTERTDRRLAAAERADRDRRVAELQGQRGQLARQVAEAEARAAGLRRLAEEERQLTEVQSTLTRQRLTAELGVSLPAAGGSAPDLGAERFDKVERQLAELKAVFTAQDGTSRLDAIERKLEQIRTAPGVQRRQ